MSVEELKEHAGKYSQTYRSQYARASSKWTTDFDAMSRKTVLKLLLSRWCPLSVEMQQAMSADQAVIGENDKLTYVDSPEAPTIEVEAEEVTHSMAEEIMSEAEQKE